MKYFIDTEFHEYQKKNLLDIIMSNKPVNTIELISIGIVSEDNKEYYAISKDFDIKSAWDNEWLRDNVLKSIFYDFAGTNIKLLDFSYNSIKEIIKEYGRSNKQITQEIIRFTQEEPLTDIIRNNKYQPQFYGYYSDYDWVVFCWLFGRMIDLPKGFPMYCIDLKQELDNRVNLINNEKLDLICSAGMRNHPKEIFRNELDLQYKLNHIKSYHKDYPKQIDEHNALADAKWNYELYKFLKTI